MTSKDHELAGSLFCGDATHRVREISALNRLRERSLTAQDSEQAASVKLEAAMKCRMLGITDDQPTRMDRFESTLFTLWSFVLPRMSRNIIFHFGMLYVPRQDH